MKKALLSLFFISLIAAGCNTNRSNNPTTDINANIQTQNQSINLNGKCAKDAEDYFDKNWKTTSDKNTILLTYTNHYNKGLNKCFILIQYNFWITESLGLWTKSLYLYDVENVLKYGEIIFNSQASPQDSNISFRDTFVKCDFPDVTGIGLETHCAFIDDFIASVSVYMNN